MEIVENVLRVILKVQEHMMIRHHVLIAVEPRALIDMIRKCEKLKTINPQCLCSLRPCPCREFVNNLKCECGLYRVVYRWEKPQRLKEKGSG